MEKIRLRIKESIETKERMMGNEEMLEKIKKAADKIIKMFHL
jgi:phosphoheptose isomerase